MKDQNPGKLTKPQNSRNKLCTILCLLFRTGTFSFDTKTNWGRNERAPFNKNNLSNKELPN